MNIEELLAMRDELDAIVGKLADLLDRSLQDEPVHPLGDLRTIDFQNLENQLDDLMDRLK